MQNPERNKFTDTNHFMAKCSNYSSFSSCFSSLFFSLCGCVHFLASAKQLKRHAASCMRIMLCLVKFLLHEDDGTWRWHFVTQHLGSRSLELCQKSEIFPKSECLHLWKGSNHCFTAIYYNQQVFCHHCKQQIQKPGLVQVVAPGR